MLVSFSISIHVPAWGTTRIIYSMPWQPEISIHVPAWGTTHTTFVSSPLYSISIHVPAWGTTREISEGIEFSYISIHVPAWGTTVSCNSRWAVCIYFNPRSRVGNDRMAASAGAVPSDFNPRSRVGNDFLFLHLLRHLRHFNPRSRVGNDKRGGKRVLWRFYFNPRSRVGNDNCSFFNSSAINKFQSTFPRGERRIFALKANYGYTISIHVPAWGTTCTQKHIFRMSDDFNPRSRVGNDSNYFQNILLYFRNNH